MKRDLIDSVLVGIFLMINAYWDIRKRKIWLWSIGVFGAVGIVSLFFVEKDMILESFCGIFPGLFLILCSYVTRQAIGLGDGMAVFVCGLYLGFWQTFAMLFYALLFCAATSIFMLALKKRTYKSGVPFLPYLFAGYVCVCLFMRGAGA